MSEHLGFLFASQSPEVGDHIAEWRDHQEDKSQALHSSMWWEGKA